MNSSIDIFSTNFSRLKVVFIPIRSSLSSNSQPATSNMIEFFDVSEQTPSFITHIGHHTFIVNSTNVEQLEIAPDIFINAETINLIKSWILYINSNIHYHHVQPIN